MKILYILYIFSPVGLWSVVRKQHKPCDESNRFNKLILLWFAFTRPEFINKLMKTNLSTFRIVMVATFDEQEFTNALPFLKRDLWINLTRK